MADREHFVGWRREVEWRCGAAALGLAAVLMTLVAGMTVSGSGVGWPVRGRAVGGGLGPAGLRRVESLPMGAQAVISGTLGADERAYRATRVGAGWRLAGGGIRANFAGAGVRLRAPGGEASLSLAGVGYDGALRVVPARVPVGVGSRVIYRYPGVVAWYKAGPLGIEQGFTLEHRPVSAPGGPLTLALRVRGALSPRLADRGRTLVLAGPAGRVVLRYGGLSVHDARGRLLRSWFTVWRGEVLIRVADAGSAYPLRVDPFIQVGNLTLTGGPPFILGESTAVSGNTVVASGADAYYVFTEPTGGWSSETQTATLAQVSGSGMAAISGSTIVIGRDVFTEPVGGWTGTVQPAAMLTLGAGAISGQTIVAPYGDSDYVFTEPAGGWSGTVSPVATLRPADAVGGAHLSGPVAISGDTVFVTGCLNADSSLCQNAIYAFSEPAAGWSGTVNEAAILTVAQAPAESGLGVGLAASGSTVVAGDGLDNSGNGPVYVFTEPRGGWSGAVHQAAELTVKDDVGEVLGFTLALSGQTVAAGTVTPENESAGAWYLYTEPSNGWSGTITTTAAPGGAAPFGTPLAISDPYVFSGTDVYGGTIGIVAVTGSITPAIAAPADGSIYRRGQVIKATYSCGAGATGAELVSCSAPKADGSPVDTSSVGSHTFTVTAHAQAGETVSQTVSYTVAGPPSASSIKLKGLASATPQLTLGLAGGAPDRAITAFTISLPPGLTFTNDRRRLTAGVALPGAGKYKLRLNHGKLKVTLATAASSIHATIRAHAIAESPSEVDRIKKAAQAKNEVSVTVHVRVSDTSKETSQLTLRTKID